MKSWFIDGDSGELNLREVPTPEPAAGEILVRLHAAGLNRGEFIRGHGLHAPGSAKAAGLEGAGEVVAVGAGVSAFKPGDAVMGRAKTGFSEFSTFAVGEAVAKPAAFSWEQAAGGSLAYWTAYDLVVASGEAAADDWVLVTAVSSGVGVAALQIAKSLGARVIGTSGSADKLARLMPLGLDLGIETRGTGFHDMVMQATAGKGVNLVVNNVGGSVFAEALGSLAYRGRIGIVGYVDNTLSAQIDLEALHAKRLRVFGVSNKMRPLAERVENVRGFARDIWPHYDSGALRPLIDRVFPFGELPAARDYMESNAQVGKIVVRLET